VRRHGCAVVGAADTPQLPVSMADDTARDRRALEVILGHPVHDEPWPEGALPAGTAVRVTREPGGHAAWRSEFTGVIDQAMAPRAVQNKHARPGELEYLVRFGTPQHDSAAGGPYRKAMIWDRYLKPL